MTVKRGGLAKKKSQTPKTSSTNEYADLEAAHGMSADDTSFYNGMSMRQLNEAKKREGIGHQYGTTEFDLGSSEAETAEVGAVGLDEVGTVPEPRPSKTAGAGGAGSKPGKPPKPGKRGKKGGLLRRISKAQGTTIGEARGTMKRARRQIRGGNKKAASRRITRALSGDLKAGVKSTPARRQAAQTAGKKIATRIATRQKQSQPRRRKK